MSILETPETPHSPNRFIIYGLLLVVVAAIGGASWIFLKPSAPAASPPRITSDEVKRPVPAPVAQPEPTPAEPAPRPRRAKAAPVKPVEAAAPTMGTIQFESDVPGASVFVDREYKGTAPLTVDGITPGSHRINMAADGYDSYVETVEVVAGPNEVSAKFKEVRLNESLPVRHKHTLGSCQGRLVADPSGIRYETSNKNDAFSVLFVNLERFEVDYLEKNLRIKERKGRTFNFTGESADALFVFHKNVQAARAKLAKEGAPVTPSRF
jgi:hypothetical protein